MHGFPLWDTRASIASIRSNFHEELHKMITLLLVILVLMAIGAFPSWGYSRNWGYFPSGGLGLVVLVLLILVLLGRV
jgi:Protein of unknown function (DUF3309)